MTNAPLTCPICNSVLQELRCCTEHGYMNCCDRCGGLTPETDENCMHCGESWSDEPLGVDDNDEDE